MAYTHTETRMVLNGRTMDVAQLQLTTTTFFSSCMKLDYDYIK